MVETSWANLFPIPDPEDGPATPEMIVEERSMPLARLVGLDSEGLLVPAILLGIAAAAGGWVAGLRGPGLGVAAGAGVLLTAIGAVALWFVARKQVARAWQPLHRSSSNLSAAADILIKAAEAEREQKERAAKQQLARERDAAHLAGGAQHNLGFVPVALCKDV
jgi:hypothetical protein